MTICSYLKYVLFAGFVAQSANLLSQKVYTTVISEQPIKIKSKFKNVNEAEKYMSDKVIHYRKDGFSEANIDSTNYKKDTLVFYLHTGEQYYWESLSFDSIPTEVISSLYTKTSKTSNAKFDATVPHKIGEDILTYYENNGYPFSIIKYDSIFIDSNKVKMKISLSKGPLIKIDSISIKGDLKINPYYVYRITGIKPGDLYNEKKIKNIPFAINSVPFMQQFRNQQLYFTSNLNILFIYLNPRKTNSFSGILGFQNDPRTNKLMITGDLALDLNNVFKQGEWIRFSWNRFQIQSQKLDLNIGFPFIFKLPIGIEGSINLFKQDSTYLDVQFEGGLLFNFATNSRATFSIASRESNTNATNLSNFSDISIINYSIRIDYTGFDYIFNPRKGFGGFVKLSIGNVDVPETTEEQPIPNQIQYQGVADVKYFVPIFKKQTLAFMFKGGTIVNDVIYENIMFRLGGLNSIRGFNEASIFANQYAIFSFEYRFLYEKNANLRVFFDGAYVENINLANPVNYPIGFGIGASIETKAGIFKIDYAMGKFGNEPITISNAKVHFGYLNTF
jgi:outer membrane protein assembly factor BamA